jgi:hypothetical protein
MTIEETILHNVLHLMKKDTPDNNKMSAQYFQFFVNYSTQGRHEVREISKKKISFLFRI